MRQKESKHGRRSKNGNSQIADGNEHFDRDLEMQISNSE